MAGNRLIRHRLAVDHEYGDIVPAAVLFGEFNEVMAGLLKRILMGLCHHLLNLLLGDDAV